LQVRFGLKQRVSLYLFGRSCLRCKLGLFPLFIGNLSLVDPRRANDPASEHRLPADSNGRLDAVVPAFLLLYRWIAETLDGVPYKGSS